MTFESVPLNAVATVIRGVTFDKTEAVDAPQDGYLPILRAGNIADQLLLEHDLVWVPETRVAIEQRMRPDDIAICMSSGSQSVVGKTAPLLHEWNGSVGAFCAVLRPKTAHILPAYLSYFLKSEVFRSWTRQSTGANIKNIRKTELESFPVPLVSLEKQRRIVDLLSRAEGIVRLRREAQAKAQAIIPALFLDMFGDPATNPKGWLVRPLASVGTLDRGRSRHRPRDAAELYGGPYPFIQTGDVANSGGRITVYTATYSEAGLQQSKLWPVGTLCITIAANIAKTGVLTFEACFPDSVVGFLPGDDVTTPYVQGWLSFLQPTIEANAPQAAQKNINLEILRALPVPVPPMPLQEQFRRHCNMANSILDQHSSAATKAEATFQSLLVDALCDTKWSR